MRSLLPILLALSIVACGEKSYRVGVLARNTAYEGVDLATRQANAKNGINGTPLRVVRADTGGATRTDTVRIADKLAADTAVKVLLQQMASGISPGLLRVFYARGIPVLALGPILEKPDGQWVFHLMPTAHDEAKLMAEQATRLWHPQRVAIVHSPDPYGVILSAEVRNLVPGSSFVLDTPYVDTQDTTVVAALERVITSAKPDVLFWLGQPRVLATMLVRLRQHLPNLPIMGSEALESKRVYENPDGIYTGLVFVRLADPSVDTARYNAFQYQYALWMGGRPTSDALLAFDATNMIVEAMRGGAVTRKQLRDYIASLGRTRPAYAGVTGPIAFDSAGVLRRSLGLAEVREDGVMPVPLQPASPTP